MDTQDKQIDAYIENSKPFAKPILRHLRKLVHQICAEVVETTKWNFPHFEYKGMLCFMAAFQEHCAFGFWKGSIMKDPHKIMDKDRAFAMGQFGRIKSLQDLPPNEILLEYLREAIRLNEEGIKVPKKPAAPKAKLEIPDFFLAALQKNNTALKVFQGLSISKKKEYLDWIVEAKQEATREKRLANALIWLSEGKSRNWKYEV